ncbi:hypothetical protein CLV57_0444 [Mucilaginibacter auburnensis]|uniref:Uncharacterized protein n=1 Tax=Mucilaginibacter auburnensis TaxID=1457233 RepID=A0A2H9VRM5_9SPHI|nr:hypothetical protein CLV57_0444 [Mucilaginibacter auburnensis]
MAIEKVQSYARGIGFMKNSLCVDRAIKNISEADLVMLEAIYNSVGFDHHNKICQEANLS